MVTFQEKKRKHIFNLSLYFVINKNNFNYKLVIFEIVVMIVKNPNVHLEIVIT